MFKKQFQQIINSLGLMQKAKDRQLTKEDWESISDSYKETYGVDFYEDMQQAKEKAGEADRLSKEHAQALEILNAMEENTGSDKESGNLLEKMNKFAAGMQKISKENADLKAALDAMASAAVPDVPVATVQKRLSVFGPGSTEKHLFGIENPLFNMSKRWNKISANPAFALTSDPDEDTDGPAFQSEVRNFGKSMAARYRYLKENKLLDPKKLNEGFGFDTADLSNAGLGDQYVVLRQDALIARILTLETVYHIFPRRSGIQDRELMTNAFFSKFSQAYQPGKVWKGDVKLQPEMAHVDDAMFKTLFGPMKEIERQYIGYLNTDGSDPIKWSMIEWQLLNIYTALVNEQNERRILGIYVKPEEGKPGHHLNGSTGYVYTLVRYIHENKLVPHSDDAYNAYTKTTMLDAVQEFVSDVRETVDKGLDIEKFEILLNKNHRSWWRKCIRAQHGKEMDFKGVDGLTDIIPDTTINIRWVPNMGQLKLICLQESGNQQCLEFAPGEMLSVKIKEDMEQVVCWSTWKEGFSASYVGQAFDTPTKLVENNYKLQRVFINKPCVTLADKATSAAAKDGFWFVTSDNTAATALTDIAGAEEGTAYIIECGGTKNATTIAKSGKFDSITAAWTPTQSGDYIMVTLNSSDKFVELERQVGGVRTINKSLQPNIPGAR